MSSSTLTLAPLPTNDTTKQTPGEAETHPDVEYEPLSVSEDPAAEEGMKESFAEETQGDYGARVVALSAAAIFVVTTWLIALLHPSSYGLFTWHPLLQSLAIGSFTYGILTLQPTSRPKTKAAGLLRHQLAMIVLGFPMIILGTSAIYYNKVRGGHPHFTTWHGFFGIVTVCLSVVQVILGGGSVWFDGKLFGGNPRAKLIWKYHRALGYVVFPLYLLSAYLGGAWSNWASKYSIFVVRLVAYWIAPFVLLVAIFARVRTSKMQFNFF